MYAFLLGVLPLIGVRLGAFLQHKFARSKETLARFEVRRHEAYADYLRGVAGAAKSNTAENLVLVADAKCRIALYGHSSVVTELAKFEREGAALVNNASIDRFLQVVEAMRHENRSDATEAEFDDLRSLLFREAEAE